MSSLRVALKLSMGDEQKHKPLSSKSSSSSSNPTPQNKHRIRSNSEASDSKRSSTAKRSSSSSKNESVSTSGNNMFLQNIAKFDPHLTFLKVVKSEADLETVTETEVHTEGI